MYHSYLLKETLKSAYQLLDLQQMHEGGVGKSMMLHIRVAARVILAPCQSILYDNFSALKFVSCT
jgi:hypothetical protein